jgi:FMN hydrolase / 5-amino-6-(5-phospho-D-ribitylamino)uracil phosphatase
VRYEVISFDMFQTLVDVNARKYDVWAGILKDEYTKDKADMFWSDTLKRSSEYTSDMKFGRTAFQPMRKTFSTCYEKLFEEHRINNDTMAAVNILFEEHSRSTIYPDAKDFFNN